MGTWSVKMNRLEENVKIVHRYSEALKRKIAEEVSRGVLTSREAMVMYGIQSRRTVNRWVNQYGDNPSTTKIVRVMMKSEKERIEELERALADEKIRTMVYAAQLQEYEELVPDFKKRLDSKALKEFEENEKKIKQFR
jgi:transposase-like protein